MINVKMTCSSMGTEMLERQNDQGILEKERHNLDAFLIKIDYGHSVGDIMQYDSLMKELTSLFKKYDPQAQFDIYCSKFD